MRTDHSLKRRLTKNSRALRLWHQERTILDITETICELMEKKRITRSDLAKRLGKTKGYITQLLDGRTNMTIRTISDVFAVLGCEFRPDYAPLDSADKAVNGTGTLPKNFRTKRLAKKV
ncbi:MAG: helix-turn-helix transcriptional regulator [Planctomycetia bacterium]|nr:helix-turn-helix transcriptional regulator [Planctomycetia bacterium]